MSFNYIRKNKKGEVISSYDDSELREIAKLALFLIFGVVYEDGDFMKIDLVQKENRKVGAEGEDTSYDGDKWVSGQNDVLHLGYDNQVIEHRKWHYWNLQHLSNKAKARYWWGKFDEGWMENIYFRLNRQGDQLIIILASTILDPEKRRIEKNRMVSTSREPEDWFVFKREDVLTYNKQPDGSWELNGKYWGPDIQECEEIQRIREEMGRKRAIEVYKQTQNK